MLAVIEVSGEQVLVREKKNYPLSTFRYDKEKKTARIEKVLLLADDKGIEVGAPYIEGAGVNLTIIEETKSPKRKAVKFKSKKRYKRVIGNRQKIIKVTVDKIEKNSKKN